MKGKKKKAVVLLSGGLDSATTLYAAKDKGYHVTALIFDYGQRHKKELRHAVRIAHAAKCAFVVMKISLPWKGSALLDRRQKIPTRRLLKTISKMIPSTYVPSRNIIFLSFASSLAEAIGARAIFIGANALDYSGYPDCRPEFLSAFQKVLLEGTKAALTGQAIRIYAPLIKKTKEQIITLGIRLKVPYGLTWSCYQGKRKPCGSCDSCLLRAKGFDALGLKDPALQ
ncbi:MAG: 7-cyano-7-deazaguanine synthase QueC [Candidatus Omnitrophota bacterium]